MRSLVLFLCLCCLAVSAVAAPPPPTGEGAKLHDLFDREWEFRLREEPFSATSVGRHDYDALLPSADLADLERRTAETRKYLAELDAIDRSKLTPEDAVNADIFRAQLQNRVADFDLGGYQMPFNADSGFHMELSQIPEQMPFRTVRDYESYLSRLRGVPRYMGQQIDRMREGIQRGFTVPRAVLDGYEATITPHIVDDPAKSVFYRPFEKMPAAIPAGEQERLRKAGQEAVLQSVSPAYRTFLDFFQKEYLPKARKTIGASEMPNGRAYYAQQIRQYTTLDMTPEEIHRVGLAQVERIQNEMKEIIRQVGFKGSFAEFLQYLRTDPKFYAKTPEELLKEAAWVSKRIDGKLPALFGRLPRLPYTVEPVPAHIAPKYTSGRYVDPPEGSTRAGIYWVNTTKLDSRPLYNLEALTLHEAVPGHHLQMSLNREMEDLPNFRRYSYISAFGEGWGLYSEWLGLEAGFYKDPYSNFGRLTYEMWRACRLVVDTGMHALGWTRQQALDYMASHTALPLHEVTTETDRYISWPGQALSYKMGEIKIRELRQRAERELGERFDVRQFHDVVLGSGSVPLGVLENNVDRYITETKSGS